jgi:hypothetical protein
VKIGGDDMFGKIRQDGEVVRRRERERPFVCWLVYERSRIPIYSGDLLAWNMIDDLE